MVCFRRRPQIAMKKTASACLFPLLLLTVISPAARAQEQPQHQLEAPVHNLPVQKIGPNDLLLLTVTDAPELTRTFRVGPDGTLSLPLLKQTIRASGRLPADLETDIAALLKSADLLVEPVVKVTVAEYHSRPISVAGAVRKPVTFQAIGGVTLLEALTRAEGLSDLAGGEILVTRPSEGPLPIRIPVRKLIDAADASLNLKLEGGEEVRVPEALRIFIAGNVRKPGAVPVREGDQLTVLKMIAMAEGLTSYASKQAYVYRTTGGEPGAKNEITVELDKIMKRQSPDVALLPNDVFYVPDNTRRRTQMTVLDRITLFGSTAGATALIWRGR